MLSQTFSDNPESWRFFKEKQARIFLMGKNTWKPPKYW
jgi:hypothetical protein